MQDDVSKLTKLGSNRTDYQYCQPSVNDLETFPNRFPERRFHVEFIFEEFTSLCPKTGQPDFAKIHIDYIPSKKCIESKSLKLYLMNYRQEGVFMETLTNRILNDLVEVCKPQEMTVQAHFKARGGIQTFVQAAHYAYQDDNKKTLDFEE